MANVLQLIFSMITRSAAREEVFRSFSKSETGTSYFSNVRVEVLSSTYTAEVLRGVQEDGSLL